MQGVPYSDIQGEWGRFAKDSRKPRGSGAEGNRFGTAGSRPKRATIPLEYKNLREHVVMNMIATMDDAKPIEIEVDERLHDLIGQAHIAAPLRNRLIIKVILPNSRTCEISTRSASLNMKSIAAPSYSRNHDGFSSRHPLYICFEYAPQQAPLAFRFAKRGAFHNTMARL